MPKKNENEVRTVDGGVAVVAEPQIEAVIEPVVQTEAKVPDAEIVKTETVPLVEPTAIVPNLVYEQTAAVADGTLDAPVIDVKQPSARRVRVICKGKLGLKLLSEGDITDDPDYVALLDTRRGRELVEEVQVRGRGYSPDEIYRD